MATTNDLPEGERRRAGGEAFAGMRASGAAAAAGPVVEAHHRQPGPQ